MTRKRDWSSLKTEELLDLRIKDLKLEISDDSMVGRCRNKLYAELEAKGLNFKPYLWVSDDWFTPDGLPGFAVPFFLLHAKLMRLTQKMLIEAEGGNPDWCMRIMRHETGHAIDNAFGLRKLKNRQKIFGLSSKPYPDTYSPKPYSRSFVVNLASWYGQAHPDEDWAETFAVWLAPRSGWRKRYKKGVARKKLDFVEETMASLQGKAAKNKSRATDHRASQITTTLRECFEERSDTIGMDQEFFFDRELLRLFTNENDTGSKPKASGFLRNQRKEIRSTVSKWSGHYSYAINDIISELISRCDEMGLYLRTDTQQAKLETIAMLSAKTAAYLSSGEYEISL